jgi:hypothetical protein
VAIVFVCLLVQCCDGLVLERVPWAGLAARPPLIRGTFLGAVHLPSLKTNRSASQQGEAWLHAQRGSMQQQKRNNSS